ncbi:MAG: PAS domain S-box protein [Bacteroidetes bacterium]|nr:PAS domain S-box protein [Bacteroidota bacterium]MBL6943950.1 PAS domain S-box protein [Bacteroidales bacterium]
METKYRILLVDDDSDLCANIQEILENNNYEVDNAHRGKDAIELCKNNHYELAIIDIRLPDIKGTELVDKIYAISPETEFIYITSNPELYNTIQVLAQKNIISYETKPVDIDHLLTIIDQITKCKQAEEESQQIWNRLLKAQQVAKMGFVDWNFITGEIYWSEEIYRLFGLDPEKVSPTPDLLLNTVHPDDLEYVQENLNRAKQGLAVDNIDHRMVRPDGTIIWVHAQGELAHDGEGNPFTLLCTVVDITSCKNAEAAAYLQSRIANIALTVSDYDMFNEVLKVIMSEMQSPLGVFGYLDEEGALVVPTMTSQVWDKCMIPGKITRFPKDEWGDSSWVRAIREKKSNFSNVKSTEIPKGHIAIHRHISTPILFLDEVIGLFQLANKDADYTENDIKTLETIAVHVAYLLSARLQRESAQAKLLTSKEKYRKLVNEVNDGFYIIDKQGVITFANNALAIILGVDNYKELIGRHFLAFVHPDHVAEFSDRFKKSIEDKTCQNSLEVMILRIDGQSAFIEVSWYPNIENEKVIGMSGIIHDITRQKRDETEIRNLNASLESKVKKRTRQLAATNTNLQNLINEKTQLVEELNVSQAKLQAQNEQLRKTQSELDDTTRKYYDLYYLAPVGYLTISQEGKILETNLLASKLLGGELNHFINKPISKFIVKDYNDIFYVRQTHLHETGEKQSFELKMKGEHGIEFWAHCSIALSRGIDGKDICSTTIMDITKSKLAKEGLIESEEKYRDLFNNAQIGMYRSKLDGSGFVAVNRKFCEILGYTKKELLTMPRSTSAWAIPNDRKKMMSKLKRNGSLKNYELNVLTKNKEIRACLISAKLYPDNDYIEGTIIDITERKKSEETVKSIEWLLHSMEIRRKDTFMPLYGDITALNTNRTILNAVGEEALQNILTEFMNLLGTSGAIYEKNGDYAAGIFSSGWCRFLDMASFKLCNTDKLNNALTCGSWRCHESCWTDGAKKSIETGQIYDIECNGGIRLYNTPIQVEDEIVGAINFGYGNPPRDRKTLSEIASNNNVDFKELRRLSNEYETRPQFIIDIAKNRVETAAAIIALMVQYHKARTLLSEAKFEAERANLAKSEFLSRMSHELRTPMNSILGFAQLMKMGELTPANKKGVNHILKNGEHLLDLINEVLDLSKIEAGKLSLSLEAVKINRVIQETMDIVGPLAKEGNVTLEFAESPYNELFVLADKQKLKQVLLNIADNAVKFNHEGGLVKIECSVGSGKTEAGARPKTARISIIDTGPGILPTEITHLFDPFQRIGSEISEVEGTGLGLSISKKLIEIMHGTIGVESTPGTGSTFWIELQLTESQFEHHDRKDDFDEPEGEASVVSGTLLYIEDNISNIHVIESIIEAHRQSISLITEMYGKNTVKRATDNAPDLILLDLDLPDIKGSKVLKLLKSNKKTKEIPVVILSADATPKQIERLMKAGAADYITKPLDITEFLKIVDEVIGGKT